MGASPLLSRIATPAVDGDVSMDDLERVREAIRASLHNGAPSLREVARRVGMSCRSLQRRLREHTTTFRTLTDQVRAEVAGEHVVAGMRSGNDLAQRLGYSDVRSLSRARKRWQD
jgi:AraC-like DNA-binding protein